MTTRTIAISGVREAPIMGKKAASAIRHFLESVKKFLHRDLGPRSLGYSDSEYGWGFPANKKALLDGYLTFRIRTDQGVHGSG